MPRTIRAIRRAAITTITATTRLTTTPNYFLELFFAVKNADNFDSLLDILTLIFDHHELVQDHQYQLLGLENLACAMHCIGFVMTC